MAWCTLQQWIGAVVPGCHTVCYISTVHGGQEVPVSAAGRWLDMTHGCTTVVHDQAGSLPPCLK
jgi:hypothetical protein